MRPQRLAVLALLLSLVAVLAIACGGQPASPAAQAPAPQAPAAQAPAPPQAAAATGDPYKIGVLAAITGPSSSLGVPERNTVQMLVDQINAKGGVKGPDGKTHPLQAVIYDTKSDNTEALVAAKKLIDEDKVSVIVGPTLTGESLAIVDAVTKAEIPLVSMAAGIKIVEPVADRKWIFKTPQSDRLVLQAIADHLKKNNLDKVAWMSVATAYGDGGKAEWDAIAQKAGLTTVANERFNETDTDMTAQLTKVKGADPKAILVWAIPPAAGVVSKNRNEMGIQAPIFQSHGVANQAFIDIATKPGAEGTDLFAGKLLVADQLPDNDPMKPILQQYMKDYQAKYNSPPSPFGGYAYDALAIITKAMETAGNDRAKLRDAIENTKGLVSVSGAFNMSAQDHNGLSPADAVTLIEIKDGKWTAKK
ncbi:MAG: ABC transporter substrate-binding protein [Anaerolineae bacterium]